MNLQEAVEKFKEEWDRFFETVEKPGSCIFCWCSRIYWNGQRERTASVVIGDEVAYLPVILCKRVKCANPECKRSWTLRPPGLMPRRHYQLCVVAHGTSNCLFTSQATLTSVADEHQCSRRTVGRWLNWIAEIADPLDLIQRLFSVSKQAAFATVFKISEMIRKAVNSGKKVFQRTVSTIFVFLKPWARLTGMSHQGLEG